MSGPCGNAISSVYTALGSMKTFGKYKQNNTAIAQERRCSADVLHDVTSTLRRAFFVAVRSDAYLPTSARGPISLSQRWVGWGACSLSGTMWNSSLDFVARPEIEDDAPGQQTLHRKKLLSCTAPAVSSS